MKKTYAVLCVEVPENLPCSVEDWANELSEDLDRDGYPNYVDDIQVRDERVKRGPTCDFCGKGNDTVTPCLDSEDGSLVHLCQDCADRTGSRSVDAGD